MPNSIELTSYEGLSFTFEQLLTWLSCLTLTAQATRSRISGSIQVKDQGVQASCLECEEGKNLSVLEEV